MGIWFAFLIPVMVLLIAALFIGRKMHWWEPIILCAISIGLSASGAALSESSQTRANEFLGGWVKSAEYYEPWNEWIDKTCYHHVCTGSGKDETCTDYPYDCSYCSEHAESYDYETSVGSGFLDGEDVWNTAQYKFGKHFVNLFRNSECSFPRNGNKWVAKWNGDSSSMIPYFIKHSYENRVQAAPTLFSFPVIDPQKIKVFSYPTDDGINNTSILTEIRLPNQEKANDLLNHYNGKYGSTKQCHAYLIVFKNRPPEAGRNQEAYWKGAGKNELVTTIGIDNYGNINWAYIFSWSKDKLPSVIIRDSIMNMKTIDAYKVAQLIGEQGVKKFTRRHFREFAYISVQPSNTSIIIIYVLTALMSIGWVVFKKFE